MLKFESVSLIFHSYRHTFNMFNADQKDDPQMKCYSNALSMLNMEAGQQETFFLQVQIKQKMYIFTVQIKDFF